VVLSKGNRGWSDKEVMGSTPPTNKHNKKQLTFVF